MSTLQAGTEDNKAQEWMARFVARITGSAPVQDLRTSLQRAGAEVLDEVAPEVLRRLRRHGYWHELGVEVGLCGGRRARNLYLAQAEDLDKEALFRVLLERDAARPNDPEVRVAIGEIASHLVRLGLPVGRTLAAPGTRSALSLAIEAGSPWGVRFALEHGADPDGVTSPAGRALFDVCLGRHGCAEEIVTLLAGAGARLNLGGRNQQKPLHLAARRNNRAAVAALLRCGAKVDSRGLDRRTPLHAAIEGGARESAELLLNAGANPGAQDRDGTTVLDLSRTVGDARMTEMVESFARAGALRGTPSGAADASGPSL